MSPPPDDERRRGIAAVVPTEDVIASPLYQWQAGLIGGRADATGRMAVVAAVLSLALCFYGRIAEAAVAQVAALFIPYLALLMAQLRLRAFLRTGAESGALRDLWLAGEPAVVSLAAAMEGACGARVRAATMALAPSFVAILGAALLRQPVPLWLVALVAVPTLFGRRIVRSDDVSLTVPDVLAALSPATDWRSWGHMLLPLFFSLPIVSLVSGMTGGGAALLSMFALAGGSIAFFAQRRLFASADEMTMEARWCRFIGAEEPGAQEQPPPFPDMKPFGRMP